MDYEYCYEHNGYKEARKQLTEDERAFFAGYKAAYDDIESCYYNNIVDTGLEDISPTLAKIAKDLQKQAVEEIRQWLNGTWYEYMISLLDNHERDEGDNKGKLSNRDYRLPEPPDDSELDDSELDDDEEAEEDREE